MHGMKLLGSALKEIAIFLVMAVIIVLPIRLFVAQPFVVDGESMHPTFENGDYLIVDELSYHFHEPHRGDVIVFRYPGNPKVFYIKRVIGLPGETITITRGVRHHHEGRQLDPHSFRAVRRERGCYITQSTHIGPGQLFVMGDNRPKSSDSRVWGLLPEQNVMGRALVRMFPAQDFGLNPGSVSLPQ